MPHVGHNSAAGLGRGELDAECASDQVLPIQAQQIASFILTLPGAARSLWSGGYRS
jgi:hypothetical protein